MIAQPTKSFTLSLTQVSKQAPWVAPVQTKALRILMVTPRYLPIMGGVENHVYQVARRLAHADADVTVLTTDLSRQLPAIEATAGVKIQRVPAYPSQRDYYYAPDLWKFIQPGQWDIIHIQSYHTLVAPMAMYAAWRAQIPYVVTFHGGGHSSNLRNQIRGLHQALLRPLLGRAAKLIATARFEIDYYGKRLHLPAERFTLIPNGCDIAHQVQPAMIPVNDDLIMSVGRLERYKGHQRLLTALPYILQQRPTVHLRIAGHGPYEAKLQQLAEQLGVAHRVEIRGIPVADRNTMATELAQARLVTLLSDYETHPMAALEALALKRPVLVTKTSGLQELAEQGLARAVALDSTPQEVAAAVLDQMENPLIPGKLELPTWDDCARELLLLYRACVGRF
ncbi:MAG: glycosyltransferase family 1 protein [Caldilinea sp. CFX5]|nr:glycosyltransferase family 1 protein [Caldilinea sp. CFX5]